MKSTWPSHTDSEELIIKEITPLTDKDCFYVVQRIKETFTYPIHEHSECELNLVENAAGARRVVGDSVQVIDDLDLVLITGSNLEHTWEQHLCTCHSIRETTIQFSPDLLPDGLLRKNQLNAIGQLFEKARNGLSFPIHVVRKVYPRFIALPMIKGFDAFVQFLTILDELSKHADEAVQLSSSAFVKVEQVSESRRIQKVQHYINTHFRELITLPQMADIAGMTPTSFSRFFRLRTGRSFSDYIIDVRIGSAARLLVDTSMTVSEICFDSGFNNLSNFNRLFRKKKGCSPSEFRANYKKKKIIY